MEIIAIPQTPNRLMTKKFNTLYYLNKELNTFLQSKGIDDKRIKVVQIFFDTEIPLEKGVEFLKLQEGILQIVVPFDWNTFSKYDFVEQKRSFIEYILENFLCVVRKYGLKEDLIISAFEDFLGMAK